MINLPLLRDALEYITSRPEEYDSWSYARQDPHTGRTTRDLAGTVCHLAGLPIRFDKLNNHKEAYLLADGRLIPDAAASELELTGEQARALFQATIGHGITAAWDAATRVTDGAITAPPDVATDDEYTRDPYHPPHVATPAPQYHPSPVPLFCGRCESLTPRLITYPWGDRLCPRCAYPVDKTAPEIDADWLKGELVWDGHRWAQLAD